MIAFFAKMEYNRCNITNEMQKEDFYYDRFEYRIGGAGDSAEYR